MRSSMAVWLGMLSLMSVASSADQPKFSAVEREVLGASEARRDAVNRRDMEAAAASIADDCLFSAEYGELVTKAQYLEHRRKLPLDYDNTSDPRDYTVRVHGDTAVINFLVTDAERYVDREIVSVQRRTETWQKRHRQWLMIAAQWDNTPVNHRVAAAADPAHYAEYVGEYEWRPNDYVDSVTVEDGKLWSHYNGGVDEYLPAGGVTFFLRNGDLGSISFVRDTLGNVKGYTYRRSDGQEIFARKTK